MSTRRKKISVILMFVLLLLSMPMAYGDNLSLIGYWSFDESKDGICPDISANNNDGRIYGASAVDGIKGKALAFNGRDSYAEISHSEILNLSSSFSISVWLYPEAVEGGYAGRNVIGKPGAGYLGEYAIFADRSGRFVSFMVAAGTNCYQVSGSVSRAHWHHLALVYDSGNLYRRGEGG